MQGSQVIASVVAATLAVLAGQALWSDARFQRRAARASATLVGFETVEVRSLFSTEAEHHPIVEFTDADGATHRFTVQSTAPRVGVPVNTAPGSVLGSDVLYDPVAPRRARLEPESRGRAALLLVLAALGLLAAPRALRWAFRSRG